MRIGILGLGRIGAFHAETLAGLDVVEQLVVSDPLAAAAQAAGEKFGAVVADSPEAVFASGIDGVVITAATDAHPGLILAAVGTLIGLGGAMALGGVIRARLFGVEPSDPATLAAVSGALVAIQRRFDIVGVFIVALLSAIGGGFLRDVAFLNRSPAFLGDPAYLSLIAAASVW